MLQRHSGKTDERRQDQRVAFSLDYCDREAMGFVATTVDISADDVRDLMTATVEHLFGRVNRLPATI